MYVRVFPDELGDCLLMMSERHKFMSSPWIMYKLITFTRSISIISLFGDNSFTTLSHETAREHFMVLIWRQKRSEWGWVKIKLEKLKILLNDAILRKFYSRVFVMLPTHINNSRARGNGMWLDEFFTQKNVLKIFISIVSTQNNWKGSKYFRNSKQNERFVVGVC